MTAVFGVSFQEGNEQVTASKSYTPESVQKFDIPVTGGGSNVESNVQIDISQLEAIQITTDRDILMETNDGTTPEDSFNLKSSVPFQWQKDSGIPNPFGADVTSLFFTLAEGDDATVKIRFVTGATP
jgi:hypothetical protein